jgi:hypothetical protein
MIDKKRRLAVITIHDAAPVFEEKICEFADELDKLNIKFNIAIIPFYKEEQKLTNYPEFVEKIKSYRALEIALHGLYHNDKKGNLDDFHARSKQQSEVEIKSGLQIITDAGFDSVKTFVPPSWYLNVESLQILEDLEFKLAETTDTFLFLEPKQDRDSYSIKMTKTDPVLNWDVKGEPNKNIESLEPNRRMFDNLLQKKTNFIRIAIHPKDPLQALQDQKEMIHKLQANNYVFIGYSDVIDHHKRDGI